MKARVDCGVCGAIKGYARDCTPCEARRKAEYKARNRDKVKAAASGYKKRVHAVGAESRAFQKAIKRLTLPLRLYLARSGWRRGNMGAINAGTAHRFASKLRATPSWSNAFFVAEAYDLARRRTLATGIEWQVDHIVPLRSKHVCGLHAHTNVAVIPKAENLAKGNRTWPDMAEVA